MKAWPSVNWPSFLANSAKLCTLVSITLANGAVKRFTDNSAPIAVSGLGTFESLSGLVRSAISLGTGLDTSNLDLTFNMDPLQVAGQFSPSQNFVNSGVNIGDILSGLYRGSSFSLYLIFPDYIADGYMTLLTGILGETKISRNTVKMTLESKVYKIGISSELTTTPSCRNKFGDTKCGINRSALSVTTTISFAFNDQSFRVPVVLNNPAVIAGYPSVGSLQNVFNFGTVTWVTGANAGLSMEISSITLSASYTTIAIWMPVGFGVSAGDSVIISPGCSKQRTNCVAYKNALNFNAEPDVPGISLMNDSTTLV